MNKVLYESHIIIIITDTLGNIKMYKRLIKPKSKQHIYNIFKDISCHCQVNIILVNIYHFLPVYLVR